jgi:hypothetical protein
LASMCYHLNKLAAYQLMMREMAREVMASMTET